ncbi:MAG: hypothetical protein NTW96_03375 [Planctomycetia bacterium]|nr:hypothetical protein [Planctomycetia bacterium]
MTTITRREFLERSSTTGLALAAGAAALGRAATARGADKVFRAGAHAVDITPDWFPVAVNGGFQPQYATSANDPLHARCLVLDDSSGPLAIVQIDSCVVGQPLMDKIKQLAHEKTGIPVERMLMATTHTHSAPAVQGALGTDPDEKYVAFLPGRVAEGVRLAQANLAPAKIGWAIGQLPEVAQSRRWIARPDKMMVDPFGEKTTRATMHPGYRNPDYEEPSGPMDPSVSVVAVQSPDGKPIALWAAYSIHYVGSPILSADYYGVFAEKIAEMVGPGDPARPFVGILSNGTSGDAYINDYSGEPRTQDRFSIAEAVAKVAHQAYRSMTMHDWAPLAMAQRSIELPTRKPRLDWAKGVLAELGDKPHTTLTHWYAREQVFLDKLPPAREVKLQALRIGELGIAAIPAEVFAISGLKIRRRSPLQPTFTVSLANGWVGYLPPPEQMAMGGYTTWLARSSCLLGDAEPKIVEAALALLDEVAGDAKVAPKKSTPAAYAAAVLADRPVVYWRLEEMDGPGAQNAVTGNPLGTFETQIAYYMPGPRPPQFPGFEPDNRSPHFVGERLRAGVDGLGETYSVELWFYNAMPSDARPVTGYLFSRGPEAAGAPGDHLALGGTDAAVGRLLFYNGDARKELLAGKTEIPMRAWTHVALVRDGKQVAVYLNGNPTPEISGQAEITLPKGNTDVFLGGRSDNFANFEGKIDEVAVYDRALSAEDVAKHYQAAAGQK